MAFTNFKLKNPFWLAPNLPSNLSNTEKFQHMISKCNTQESLKIQLLKIKQKTLNSNLSKEEVYNILSLIAFAAFFTTKDQYPTLPEIREILEELNHFIFESESSSDSSTMDSD